jgi:phytoene/squalene synthetase
MTEVNAFDHAIHIAKSSRSPMERAAAALDDTRYSIFCATYASMRVIDDFVDDEFLALPKREAAARTNAVETVTFWRDNAIAALVDGVVPSDKDPFQKTHVALAATSHVAIVDPGPWENLSAAMIRDVVEAPMKSWQDFLAYAEGATAAPAAVFIEILALEKRNGRLTSTLHGPAVEHIRNSAILLYLVHIMRDLEKDAAKGPHLLTLPEEMFEALGMTPSIFAAAASTNSALAHRVRSAIADYASNFLMPALGELNTLDEKLSANDSAILRGLCIPYIEQYERFATSN